MKISIKSVLAAAGAALLLGGCATYDYGNGYGYNGYGPYAPADGYYDPYPGYGYYSGPAVGFGLGFSSSSGDWEHHHHHHEWRDRDHR